MTSRDSLCFHRLCRYMGTLGPQVMCDNIPGLINKQRQLCRQHPKVMQAIGAGIKNWIGECQHQFRNHRWNCNTMAREHNLFGRLLHRSKAQVYCFKSNGCLHIEYVLCAQPAVKFLSDIRSYYRQ